MLHSHHPGFCGIWSARHVDSVFLLRFRRSCRVVFLKAWAGAVQCRKNSCTLRSLGKLVRRFPSSSELLVGSLSKKSLALGRAWHFREAVDVTGWLGGTEVTLSRENIGGEARGTDFLGLLIYYSYI